MKWLVTIFTTFTILILTSCSIGKLVKKPHPVEIKNDNVQLAIPLAKPITAESNKITTTLTRTQKIQATNDVATHVGIIVLIICFLPVIILYVNWCMATIHKIYKLSKKRTEE